MSPGKSDSVFSVVYSRFNPWEAQLVRHALEIEGIESFIDNDYILHANWLFSNAVGGVRVRVHGGDAERAGRIIREMDRPAEMPEGELPPHEPAGAESDEPEAGRPHPRGQKGRRKKIITWAGPAAVGSYILLGAPLLFRKALKRGEHRPEDEAE
jgi:hypothetical protein